VLVDPAGKKAVSPGLRRCFSPRSSVITTAPEMICAISSSEYTHLKRPALQSQAIMQMAPSWLTASTLARVRGAPSRIQSGFIGIKSSSTVAGAAPDTGTPDGCWHVQEPVEQVLVAIEREKSRALGSLVAGIGSLERRVASLEEDRNRRDELDAAAVVALWPMRG
jgi:hypothetical protein